MAALYTLCDNMTPYKTESVRSLGLMNSETKKSCKDPELWELW